MQPDMDIVSAARPLRAVGHLALLALVWAACAAAANAQQSPGMPYPAMPHVLHRPGDMRLAQQPPPRPVLQLAPPARAPEHAPSSELEQRLLSLERELDEQRREQADLRAKLAEATKANGNGENQAPQPYVVGSDLEMSASWNHGLQVQSAHKDFRVHVGGRTQIDAVWLADNDEAFRGAGGIGDQDSVNFRRARLRVDGTMYEFIDWACEYEFLNTVNLNQGLEPTTQNNTVAVPCPTDLWADIRDLPVVGHLRMGNFKEPIGLEHQTSSRFLDFMERSYLQDAYTGPFNNGFTPGVMLWDTSEDKRWHYDLGVFKNNSNIFAFGVGEAEYAVTARLTHLLWYDEPSEGRYLVHVGAAASHRDTDDRRLRIRSRGSLRNGPPGPLNPVLADTGTYFAENQDLLALEGAVVWGAWLVQSEYIASFASQSALPNGTFLGTTFSHGYYFQVLYFLTGEHRAYDHDRAAFGRVIPYENFYLVRGIHGLCHGRGAWQAGARYNYLDLRDEGLDGGIIQDWTLGLNWFFNPNMKVQYNYVLTHRDGQGGTGEGYIHGYGVRLAYDF